jgi:hypothetical protein
MHGVIGETDFTLSRAVETRVERGEYDVTPDASAVN